MADKDKELRFLTIEQVADRLGVARRTVTDIMPRLGVTRYEISHRVVRYDADELEAAIRKTAVRK